MFGLSKKNDAVLFKAVWAGDERKSRETLAGEVALVNARVSAAVRREAPELEEGATALHLAARRGHKAIVELLLSLRADPKAESSSSGATPLHFASAGGHTDIASLLIDKGVSIDAKDGQGCTPLHRAAASGDVDLVEFLVGRSAAVTARNVEEETPLHAAVAAGYAPVAKILLSVGADVHARDNKGRTPMHCAMMGSVSVQRGTQAPLRSTEAIAGLLNMLMSYGAQINDQDQVGETPFDILVKLGGKLADPILIGFFNSHGGQCIRYRSRQPAPTRSAPPPFAASTEATMARTPSPASSAPSASPASPSPQSTSHRSASSWGSAPIILSNKPVTLGRNPDCDIRYLSLTLSHRHARIEPRDGGFFISDLGSRNGVLIDNVKINSPHKLQPNELITLGAYEFEFDGKQLIPTHGEIPEADLLAEQRLLEKRKNSSTGTTMSAGGGPAAEERPKANRHT